jgi:hypothetical protein
MKIKSRLNSEIMRLTKKTLRLTAFVVVCIVLLAGCKRRPGYPIPEAREGSITTALH